LWVGLPGASQDTEEPWCSNTLNNVERRNKISLDNKVVVCYLSRNPSAELPCFSVEGKVLAIEAKQLVKTTLRERIETTCNLMGLV